MRKSNGKGKVLKSVGFAKIYISLLLALTISSIAHADQLRSPILIHQDQPFIVKSETVRIVTAYNAGDPRQTDDTPCISANGENICKALAKGKKRCAANFVPLGSRLHVDKIGVCLVTDRTNKRYRNRVDIAMHKDDYQKARRFGRQRLHVKIIEPVFKNKYPASEL